MAIKTENDNEQAVRDQLTSRFQNVATSVGSRNAGIFGNLLAQSAASYQKKWKRELPASSKAVLMQSLDKMTSIFQNRDHLSRETITSAVSDIAKVDNPITLAYNLMSILIPNFAYTEVIGIQPIPTKESPVFYPRIAANESRNNIAKGETLLGSTNWNDGNSFTTNQVKYTIPTVTAATINFTVPEANIIPGSLVIQINVAGTGTRIVFDDGQGGLVPVAGFTPPSTPGIVNYKTGVVQLSLLAAPAAGSTGSARYRYEFAEGTKPAQAVLEWVTAKVRAEPYRIRTIYELDDFFQVKQVLSGYDVDSVLSSSVAGYINKEISGNVFDDILLKTDADFAWNSVAPAGVAWALHRLSLLQTFVRASNGIRQNIARAEGNIAICGNEWMNAIEVLGDDLWKPEKYAETPIGPYVAGTLAGKIKILKNQDYPDTKAAMVYKRDDVDASIIGGVFIGLYATNPIAMDDLKVIQGMGTQFGWLKTFDNSIVSLTLQQ
jgi:hypothetical protein